MAPYETAYMITVGELNIDGVLADEFEETLIFVGRLIEQFNKDDNYIGKYIYVVEHALVDGAYVKKEGLFTGKYLIEK